MKSKYACEHLRAESIQARNAKAQVSHPYNDNSQDSGRWRCIGNFIDELNCKHGYEKLRFLIIYQCFL